MPCLTSHGFSRSPKLTEFAAAPSPAKMPAIFTSALRG
jgi:hypothetical protein